MNKAFSLFFIFITILFFPSCDKHEDHDHDIVSNDGIEARLSYVDEGYNEVEIEPIVKSICFFEEWNKDIETPVSGLFEYYDAEGNWVATISFGDGTCDEWATKTWDINLFPNYPSGSEEFSVFDYFKDEKGKKDK